jgi:hypothetical protein
MLVIKNRLFLFVSAITMTILVVACFAYLEGYRLDLSKDSAPAWIQAVGSILAIVAAAWIAKQQNVQAQRREEFQQAKTDKQKLEVIMALMSRSHRLAIDVCKAFESNKQEDINEISPLLMADTHQALMALPVFEIPSWQLSLDVLMIGRALASLQEQFLTLQDSASDEDFHSRLETLNELADEIKQVTGDAISISKTQIKERDLILGYQSRQRSLASE